MQKRNLALVVLFSYITLGIYAIYWLYITRKEYVAVTGDKKAILPVSLLFAPLLGFLAMTILLFVVERVTNIEVLRNIVLILTLLVTFASLIALIVIPFVWFYKYCQAFSKITGGTEPILSYVICLISTSLWFGPIWMLLVQNDINKALDTGTIRSKEQPAPATPTPAV